MKVAGLQKVSLIDFPEMISAVIFTQGCNFNCPFCHNRQLIPQPLPHHNLLNHSVLWSFLNHRRNQLDGIVVSGGEPTLQQHLNIFFKNLKDLGYKTKLDTNGSHPKVIRSLIKRNLLDFIAMDIKAPWNKYNRLAGCKVEIDKIQESVKLIHQSTVPHTFRTTWYKKLLTEDDLVVIRQQIPANSDYIIQEYQDIKPEI